MKITEGITLILAPTRRFQESLAFFRDVIGLPVVDEGVPVTDTQFRRYAQLGLPNGVVLEIVEPRESVGDVYRAPVVSITWRTSARPAANWRSGMSRSSRQFSIPGTAWGWTYFTAPDGAVYQLQGPLLKTTIGG